MAPDPPKRTLKDKIKHIAAIGHSEERLDPILHPHLEDPSSPHIRKPKRKKTIPTPNTSARGRPSRANHQGLGNSSSQKSQTATKKKSVIDKRPSNHQGPSNSSNQKSQTATKKKSVIDKRPSNHQGPNNSSNQKSQIANKKKSVVGKQPSNHHRPGLGQRNNAQSRRRINPPPPIPPPTGIRKIFYSTCALVLVNFFAFIIAIVSIFVLSILYVVIPRSFFGPAESLYVAVFMVLPLCGLGISYLCVTSFTVFCWKSHFHEIGYIFNGSIAEACVYLAVLLFFSWIAVAPSEETVRRDMKKAIADNDMEPWHKTQGYFQCCGMDGWTDFRNFTGKDGFRFPLSCCLNRTECSRNVTVVEEGQVWKPGCVKSVLFVSTALNYSALAVVFLAVLITTLGLFSVREAFKHKTHPKHIILFNEPNWMLPMSPGCCSKEQPDPTMRPRPNMVVI